MAFQDISFTKLMGSYAQTVAECRNIHKKGSLSITPQMTVTNLENRFNDIFGIRVKVLIRDRDLWVEPGLKNKFTLEEQNNQSLFT